MADERKATIAFTDARNPEKVEEKLVDIVQLDDTYKAQPRDNSGAFIHILPPERRTHVDSYPKVPDAPRPPTANITATVVFSGVIQPGVSVPMASGQTIGYAGYVTTPTGQIGTILGHVSGTSLALSSEHLVYGTLFVGYPDSSGY